MVMMSAVMSAPEGQEVYLPLNMPMDGPSILLPGMVFNPENALNPGGGESSEDEVPASAEEEQSEEHVTTEEDTGVNETNDEVMFDPNAPQPVL